MSPINGDISSEKKTFFKPLKWRKCKNVEKLFRVLNCEDICAGHINQNRFFDKI